jgi:peptidoglycan L-alanyl-D-glutamate endopeptidase CwlK
LSLVADIKAIQRHCGAEPDGVFGPRTAQAVLLELSARAGMERDLPPAELDDRTMEHLLSLDKKAQDRFTQFCLLAKATAATFGCDYVMIEGHRTWEEQDALYKKGPSVTKARGGQSNHNFGIAADYGVFRGKSYLDEANPDLAARVHEACAVHARKLGFEWGGDWKGKLQDCPHFEISTGLTLAQKRKLYAERGSVL